MEAIAFMTDVHSVEETVKFLAAFIDKESTTTDFAGEVEKAYAAEQYEAVEDIIRHMEARAEEYGFVVVWNNGVFVYRASDIEDEED